MASMIRCRIGQSSIKWTSQLLSRVLYPDKCQRLYLHTTTVLDAKGKELLMPSLSPTMETGTIVKWLKKEGDSIQPGDAVADIQTDKAVMSMEMDDEAVMAKIIITEGTKDIKVGTLIALTVEPDEDWKSVEMPSSAGSSAPASAPTPAASSPPQETSAPAQEVEMPAGQVNISMPALSPTMESGTIVKWLKKEGDSIEPGDALADIQTDKAVMTFELDEEGVLAKILMPEGSQVTVGQLIAVTMEKGTDWKTAVVPSVTKPAATAASPAAPAAQAAAPSAAKAAPSAPSSSQPPPSGQVYGLAVKRLLEEYGLSSGSIKGTGRVNRLLKGDVIMHIQANNIQKVDPTTAAAPKATDKRAPAGAPGKPAPFVDIPVSTIRAVIAKRLGESKRNIPHSYSNINIKLDKLKDVRSKLKADNVNVSINDFIIKASAHALLECPDVNSLYQNNQIIRAQNVDISVAVATPTGLITPIIFGAASKGLSDISRNVKELAEKAKTGTLKPDEFQGGTFTISNLGMFGIKEFSAIINLPQTAILAVGGGQDILDATMLPSTIMTATLSYDRRAIDEDQAADFLAVLKAMLEDPTFLAVGRAQALRHKRE